MVNIDSVGMTSTKVWVQRADKKLLEALVRIASTMKVPLAGVNVQKVGDTDSHPFLSKKIPVIDLHAVTQNNLGLLHSGQDSPEWIQESDYYDTYRLAAFYLAYLDMVLDAKPAVTNQ